MNVNWTALLLGISIVVNIRLFHDQESQIADIRNELWAMGSQPLSIPLCSAGEKIHSHPGGWVCVK